VNLQFFPVQPSALGLKGASSPFFVAPARRNRWHFSGSLLVSKENIPRPLLFSLTQFYATIPVTKTFGETPMLYYAAPMEGFTDRVWRQTHQKWFGAQGAADLYYAPFISPPENRVLIKKKMAELAPAANPGAPVIPQLLAKDGELAAWMIGELRGLGYSVLPMVVSLVGSCLLRLVWIATIFQLNRTPFMLYISYPISWVLTASVHLICLLVVRHKMNENLKAAAQR